jgi:hypothetical protein
LRQQSTHFAALHVDRAFGRMNIRHCGWSAGGVGLQNRLLDEKVWAIKFLKAVRLDASDSLVYSQEGAAREGEWVVSGGYAVCDPKSVTHRSPIAIASLHSSVS